ncbi:hypothetical protein, partial [Rhizobium ruizarguesonis]|uniref:hypothetical protein n=1 Tax=Rhizobium ruizarguesonis TaxID=2081791 RepID=UPI001A8C31F1
MAEAKVDIASGQWLVYYDFKTLISHKTVHLGLSRGVSGADSMALPVWQAEASSADDRWWLQRLSPGKDGGRERRDG